MCDYKIENLNIEMIENQTSSFPFTVKIFAKWLLVHIDTVQHHSKKWT